MFCSLAGCAPMVPQSAQRCVYISKDETIHFIGLIVLRPITNWIDIQTLIQIDLLCAVSTCHIIHKSRLA